MSENFLAAFPPRFVSMEIPPQAPLLNVFADVNEICCESVPIEFNSPLITNRVLSSNFTVTLGSIVRVYPGNSVTSPVTIYGLFEAYHVVSSVKLPLIYVGCADAVFTLTIKIAASIIKKVHRWLVLLFLLPNLLSSAN